MSANQSSGPGTFDPDKFRKGDFNLGQRLLRVAIIADTHVSEADGVSNSPFAVNKLANERLRYAIACVNHLGPDLCIHLGDMTHPVPGRPALFAQAVDCFRRQIAQIKCETLLLPGNHDVGDKPLAWSPAEPAREAYIELWKQAFGPDYRAITRGGCHFLTLNAQLLNTGFAAEQRQREWFCEYLEARKGGRFFVNLHYPPFLHEPGEPEHYDNIGGHGRAWLLDTLKRHRVEALFAGHAHHFWCHRYQDTDCYILPSTAFVRQDYSEMFRAAPMEGSEYGRDDRQKLGFVLLEIYEGGHLCRPVRTDGGRLPEGTRADAYTPPRSLRLPPPLHPRQSPALNLGFDMRKDWLESTQIPPSGSLDEFDRKQARNDYPLMALWEMGVRYARIPFADLDSRRRLARLRACAYMACAFGYSPTARPSGGYSNTSCGIAIFSMRGRLPRR